MPAPAPQPTDPPPVRYVPRKLRRVCAVTAAALVAVFAAVAWTLHGTSTGHTFGRADQVATFLFGCLLGAGVLALARPRVEADRAGVRIRNIIGGYDLPWAVVVGVRLDEDASWAALDLADDETVAVMALMATDGRYAIDGVLSLRRLLVASRVEHGR